jgi:hypothetical protein
MTLRPSIITPKGNRMMAHHSSTDITMPTEITRRDYFHSAS